MYVVCLETQDLGEPDYRRHLRLFHLLSDWDTDATENTTDTHSQYGNERRFQGFLFETWRPSPKQSQWAWVPAFLNSNNVDHILQIKWKGQGGDLMATSHLNYILKMQNCKIINWHLCQCHLNKDAEGMQILITCPANYHNNMFTKLNTLCLF